MTVKVYYETLCLILNIACGILPCQIFRYNFCFLQKFITHIILCWSGSPLSLKLQRAGRPPKPVLSKLNYIFIIIFIIVKAMDLYYGEGGSTISSYNKFFLQNASQHIQGSLAPLLFFSLILYLSYSFVPLEICHN